MDSTAVGIAIYTLLKKFPQALSWHPSTYRTFLKKINIFVYLLYLILFIYFYKLFEYKQKVFDRDVKFAHSPITHIKIISRY